MAVITISREMGTGAYHIAEEVARKLKYTLVDGERISACAPKYGLSPDMLQMVDEKPPSYITAEDRKRAAALNTVELILLDTAGRLHTRFNLMEELKKVNRVIGKALPGAPHATWLVLDATTGQNALQQAKAFKEAVGVNGVILSKLDSSARGGMAFAIQRELKLPILFAGLGEKPEDLVPFDPDAFIEGILGNRSLT